MRLIVPTALLFSIASPAVAQVRIVPDQPTSAAAAVDGVDVFVMNEGEGRETVALPVKLQVVATDRSVLTLYRVGDASVDVAGGGFAKWRYRNIDPVVIAAKRSEPSSPTLPEPQTSPAALAQTEPDIPPVSPGEQTVLSSTGSNAGFLDRFSPYKPIYGVFGANDAGAKLQFSLAFQPFASSTGLSGLKAAYTQTLFWDIQEPSGPFRERTYSPEVYYEFAASPSIDAAFGYAHDSNGKGEIGSVDVNRIYARVAKHFELGNGWRADVAPQAWFYVGAEASAPDIDRYWGYTSLTASIDQIDGIKLSGFVRGNPGTGEGAAELFASYPLTRLGGGLGIYLFGQAFTGSGEALSDYRITDTHARIGIAFTR